MQRTIKWDLQPYCFISKKTKTKLSTYIVIKKELTVNLSELFLPLFHAVQWVSLSSLWLRTEGVYRVMSLCNVWKKNKQISCTRTPSGYGDAEVWRKVEKLLSAFHLEKLLNVLVCQEWKSPSCKQTVRCSSLPLFTETVVADFSHWRACLLDKQWMQNYLHQYF